MFELLFRSIFQLVLNTTPGLGPMFQLVLNTTLGLGPMFQLVLKTTPGLGPMLSLLPNLPNVQLLHFHYRIFGHFWLQFSWSQMYPPHLLHNTKAPRALGQEEEEVQSVIDTDIMSQPVALSDALAFILLRKTPIFRNVRLHK